MSRSHHSIRVYRSKTLLHAATSRVTWQVMSNQGRAPMNRGRISRGV